MNARFKVVPECYAPDAEHAANPIAAESAHVTVAVCPVASVKNAPTAASVLYAVIVNAKTVIPDLVDAPEKSARTAMNARYAALAHAVIIL